MAGQEVSQENRKGRAFQKNRTRKALVEAAGALMREGLQPTVTDVAEAAEISRATAYRYFPTQELLWAEVALFASSGPLFPAVAEDVPVPEAVGNLVRRVGTWAYANEQPLRTVLRLSLDPSTGVRRPGHRIEWIADALAPIRNQIDPETYGKLSKALTLMLGIDPIVVMKDIAGASREQALATLEWSARALVEAALGVGGRPKLFAETGRNRKGRSV
jgi:AcrR family transcriptional regulator